MINCPACHHPNPPGTERCLSCGAWIVQDDERKPDQAEHPTRSNLADQVRSLLAQGRKIEAIKFYREATGTGLKEAKEAVDALQEGGTFSQPAVVGSNVERELLGLLERGEKVQAIKVYRERTGVGLKVAKQAVEALASQHGIHRTGAGCASLLVLSLGSGVLFFVMFARWV